MERVHVFFAFAILSVTETIVGQVNTCSPSRLQLMQRTCAVPAVTKMMQLLATQQQ